MVNTDTDVQTKVTFKKVDRKVEVDDVMRSYMELSKAVGASVTWLLSYATWIGTVAQILTDCLLLSLVSRRHL